MTDYKSMFEQAVRTLAAIDDALGIGDDGCCDPDQTLDAIACLKASPISEEAMDILRYENDKLKAEVAKLRKVGAGDTVVQGDGTRSHLEAATAHRTKLRDMLWDVPASMALTEPELRAGVELQRKEIDRLKQQLRDEGDRIAELKRAIEAMRVAGGSVEFQIAFDMAKALIVTPNAALTGAEGVRVEGTVRAQGATEKEHGD